jgi:hypothetical protein
VNGSIVDLEILYKINLSNFLAAYINNFHLWLPYADIVMASKTLFRISATVNAVCVVGHLVMGFQAVYPAIRTISTPQHRVGQRAAQNAWNFMAGSVLIASKATFCPIVI